MVAPSPVRFGGTGFDFLPEGSPLPPVHRRRGAL